MLKMIEKSGFDFPPESEHTFSALYFHENPILDVSTIEERIKANNLRRVKKSI